ncbi:MAG: MBL fold metallo-hydrolase [Patescibacteria group bacterium]
MKKPRLSFVLFGCLLLLDCIFWFQILSVPPSEASLVMLNVGQGDSSLVIFPSGATVLTDAGPNRLATRVLDTVVLPTPQYIDLAVVTHPQLDHYGGFSDVLDHYDIGAFLMTGRVPDDSAPAWQTLVDKIKAKSIPVILVGRGDQITQGESKISILSPDATFRESGELNDTGIVQYVVMASTSILLTADIGEVGEKYLVLHDGITADILKVAHHGSRYSSSKEFLEAIQPKLAVIGVGENRYGHPSPDAMKRLKAILGDAIFRTDRDGTVRITFGGGKARVLTEK